MGKGNIGTEALNPSFLETGMHGFHACICSASCRDLGAQFQKSKLGVHPPAPIPEFLVRHGRHQPAAR